MKTKQIIIFLLLITAVLTMAACSSTVSEVEDEGLGIIDSIENKDNLAEPENNTLTESEKTEQQDPVEDKAVYIKANISGVNVRSKPSSSSTSVGTMDAGDMVLYLGTEEKWYKTYFRGKIAYVSSLFSTLHEMEKGSDTIEKVILEGAMMLGAPYVYGAIRLHYGDGKISSKFDINKFDCSSFTQYMYYYGANVNLDVTTRTQIKQGKYVSRDQIKRGDLMFFTNSSRKNLTGIERVGHVAVYLGENYILHTASDHAVIEKISSTRWSYYIESRRFI